MTGLDHGTPRLTSQIRKGLSISAIVLGGYALLAYVVVPSLWPTTSTSTGSQVGP